MVDWIDDYQFCKVKDNDLNSLNVKICMHSYWTGERKWLFKWNNEEGISQRSCRTLRGYSEQIQGQTLTRNLNHILQSCTLSLQELYIKIQ